LKFLTRDHSFRETFFVTKARQGTPLGSLVIAARTFLLRYQVVEVFSEFYQVSCHVMPSHSAGQQSIS
jgi:hypothetical protein